MVFPPGWALAIPFCVFAVLGSETETGSVKSSYVLARLWAMGWASLFSLSVSDACVGLA
jgi:hypothetical protein